MKIVVFGDSISWGAWDKQGGWVRRLKDFYRLERGKDHRLYNLSRGGETTSGLVRRFQQEAKWWGVGEGDLVVFAVGINDSRVGNGGNQVPLDQFRSNLHALLHQARRLGSDVVCVGLTPVDESRTARWDDPYLDREVDRYDTALEAVCRREEVHFVELFDYVKFLGPQALEDGLHPDGYGHRRIFELVKKALSDWSLL